MQDVYVLSLYLLIQNYTLVTQTISKTLLIILELLKVKLKYIIITSEEDQYELHLYKNINYKSLVIYTSISFCKPSIFKPSKIDIIFILPSSSLFININVGTTLVFSTK